MYTVIKRMEISASHKLKLSSVVSNKNGRVN